MSVITKEQRIEWARNDALKSALEYADAMYEAGVYQKGPMDDETIEKAIYMKAESIRIELESNLWKLIRTANEHC